jgi:hypothetical protein
MNRNLGSDDADQRSYVERFKQEEEERLAQTLGQVSFHFYAIYERIKCMRRQLYGLVVFRNWLHTKHMLCDEVFALRYNKRKMDRGMGDYCKEIAVSIISCRL